MKGEGAVKFIVIVNRTLKHDVQRVCEARLSLKNPLDLGDKMYIRLATNQSYSEVMQHFHKSL